MGNDDFEEHLKQYGTLTRKLLDVEKELDRLHESIRVEGVYTCTSSNKAIWSTIHEKITELTEVSKELHDTLHRILTMRETSKPLWRKTNQSFVAVDEVLIPESFRHKC